MLYLRMYCQNKSTECSLLVVMYIQTDELPVTVIFIAFNREGRRSTVEVLTPKHEVIQLIQSQGADFCSKHKFIKLILRTQREQNVHVFSLQYLENSKARKFGSMLPWVCV